MQKAKGLTPKERAFVEEYLVDLNQTQAAIRAGYSAKRAADTGWRLAHKEAVAAAIAKEMDKRSRRVAVSADRVVQELARIAFVEPMDIVDPQGAQGRREAGTDGAGALYSVKVKCPAAGGESEEREVKLGDKLKALDLLAKHLNLYEDKGGAADGAAAGVVVLPQVLQADGEKEDGP